MVGYEAGLWGLFGGFAVSGLELQGLIRRRGCMPWRWRPGPKDAPLAVPEITAPAYFTGEIIRCVISMGLAWAAAATGQIAGALAAVAIGAAAPLIIDQISQAAPAPLSAKALAVGMRSSERLPPKAPADEPPRWLEGTR